MRISQVAAACVVVLVFSRNVLSEPWKCSVEAQNAASAAQRRVVDYQSRLDGVTRRVAEASAELDRVNARRSRTTRLDLELAKVVGELANKIDDKPKLLREYRKGRFCSGCGLTESQIHAQGEQFPHPGQRVIAATEEQIKAKERELDREIASLEQRLTQLGKERQSESDELARECDLLTARVAQALAVEQEFRARLFQAQAEASSASASARLLAEKERQNESFPSGDGSNKADPMFPTLLDNVGDKIRDSLDQISAIEHQHRETVIREATEEQIDGKKLSLIRIGQLYTAAAVERRLQDIVMRFNVRLTTGKSIDDLPSDARRDQAFNADVGSVFGSLHEVSDNLMRLFGRWTGNQLADPFGADLDAWQE